MANLRPSTAQLRAAAHALSAERFLERPTLAQHAAAVKIQAVQRGKKFRTHWKAMWQGAATMTMAQREEARQAFREMVFEVEDVCEPLIRILHIRRRACCCRSTTRFVLCTRAIRHVRRHRRPAPRCRRAIWKSSSPRKRSGRPVPAHHPCGPLVDTAAVAVTAPRHLRAVCVRGRRTRSCRQPGPWL